MRKWEELSVVEQFRIVDSSVDWRKFSNTIEQTEYVKQIYEALERDENKTQLKQMSDEKTGK